MSWFWSSVHGGFIPGWTTARSAPARPQSATPPTRTSLAVAPPPAPPRPPQQGYPQYAPHPQQQQHYQPHPQQQYYPVQYQRPYPQQQGYPGPPQGYPQGYGPPSIRAPSLRPPPGYQAGVAAPPPQAPLDAQGLTPAQAYQAQVAHGQWRSPSPAPPLHAPPPQRPPSRGPPALSLAIGGDGGRLGINFDTPNGNVEEAAGGGANGNAGEEDDEESELPWARRESSAFIFSFHRQTSIDYAPASWAARCDARGLGSASARRRDMTSSVGANKSAAAARQGVTSD
ncbi:hypothetical protein MVEN_00966800 [Mycena venus]|uniref:Uncharacterized protein n=1 Tax=Mycena venus TaxID=2733690 RepID=A0A8H6YE33_9AGAR|nr:hypothetical protein MVEN_00966800 [Mycena venus]